MKSRTAAILVAGATSAVAAGASADTGSFGNWAVVCDNVRTCTAVGFGELGEMGSSGFLEIRRSGEADAAPSHRSMTRETAPIIELKFQCPEKVVRLKLKASRGE